MIISKNGTQWTKGICLIWSRGRHFSPSLPAWQQLSETWIQRRSPGRNLGEHRSVRRSGATSRGYYCAHFLVFMQMRRWRCGLFWGFNSLCKLSFFPVAFLLLKLQEILSVVEFFKVCPCASEKAICGRPFSRCVLVNSCLQLGQVLFVRIFPIDSLALFFLFWHVKLYLAVASKTPFF